MHCCSATGWVGGCRVDHVPGDLGAHVAHVFGSALERSRPCPAGEPGMCSPVPVLWLTWLCSAGVGVLSGLLYATGGHDGPLVRKSVEVYDPGTNTWKQVADMNMCRRNAGNTISLSVVLGSVVCVWFLMQFVCLWCM